METESTIGRHFHYSLPESVDDLLAAQRKKRDFHARTIRTWAMTKNFYFRFGTAKIIEFLLRFKRCSCYTGMRLYSLGFSRIEGWVRFSAFMKGLTTRITDFYTIYMYNRYLAGCRLYSLGYRREVGWVRFATFMKGFWLSLFYTQTSTCRVSKRFFTVYFRIVNIDESCRWASYR